MTDAISDMLARIRNALLIRKEEVVIPYSLMKESILKIFLDEGYIKDYRITTEGKKNLIASLKYSEDGSSVIRELKRVSLPGRRVYMKPDDMQLVIGGLGTGVVSTSKGLKTVKQCKQEIIGGEYICQIW
jgi:small subunit ribosomal protein S8